MKARIPQGAGGTGNMNQMMQRMQKMQEEMTRAQAELEEKVYHVSAGGGNIEVEINGKKEVTSVTLKTVCLLCAGSAGGQGQGIFLRHSGGQKQDQKVLCLRKFYRRRALPHLLG